ncbi:hypothetical protein CK503_12830 [Aliifodinibius salipaludis]|uniref:Uncharacterized protein n=2 Tax=Fodinibius salipaludis TaxID=2032627 RepID=A0A2A2G6P2_9BACT|nr:hypothetical protein CK503_12830 [Aliifodinibius salipaludis]
MGLFSYSSVGQGAQATMRVSVTVVSGSTIDVEMPELILLSQNKKSDLGSLNFKGINEGNVLINSANKIILTDQNGNQIIMNIESNRRQEQGTNGIHFKGQSEGQLLSSMYQGELTTSIAYF